MGSWGPCGDAAPRTLSVLLVGPRRTGKSSAGNTLLGGEQIFDTSGGNASTAASAFTAGRHLTVVDAQGWGSSEEPVPRQEKVELLRALSLCGPFGPHVILLVIPLLDFTEAERRVVETRLELLTPAVWRHIMVLFTFGDLLKQRKRTVQEHITCGGAALQWLMKKCCYRYYVLNNKEGASARSEVVKQERIKDGGRMEVSVQRKNLKGKESQSRGGAAEGTGLSQARELLCKVEDLLQENGWWHFSLHMYQRLEEEWSRRELQLRERMEADVRRARKERESKTETAELELKDGGKQNVSRGREDEEGKADEETSVSMEVRGWIDREGQSSGFDSRTVPETETIPSMEGEKEESPKLMDLCLPNGDQRPAPIRGLA